MGLHDVGFLERLDGVEVASLQPDGQVTVRRHGPVLARVGHALVQAGIEPPDLRVELPGLEDAYLTLTGAAPNNAAGPVSVADEQAPR